MSHEDALAFFVLFSERASDERKADSLVFYFFLAYSLQNAVGFKGRHSDNGVVVEYVDFSDFLGRYAAFRHKKS